MKSPLGNRLGLGPTAHASFTAIEAPLQVASTDTRNKPVVTEVPAAPTTPAAAVAIGQRMARFWLRALFFTSEYATWLPLSMTKLVRWGVLRFSPAVRSATLANAARILGPQSTPAERLALSQGVVESFFKFCIDVGRSANMTPDQLMNEISEVVGRDHYDRARASGKGLIIATAHMGSFEVGLTGLAMQGQRLHVIFQRDEHDLFERQRSSLRRRLNICESPIDDGWTMWMGLRDALERGEAVVMQADRVMPGQRGQKLPFLHGHLEMPPGPAKLAQLTGAWILPIFSVRQPDGKVRLMIEPPITPADDLDDAPPTGAARRTSPLLRKLATVIEKYVRAYPDQWLMFHPAFCEDQNPPASAGLLKDPPRA